MLTAILKAAAHTCDARYATLEESRKTAYSSLTRKVAIHVAEHFDGNAPHFGR